MIAGRKSALIFVIAVLVTMLLADSRPVSDSSAPSDSRPKAVEQKRSAVSPPEDYSRGIFGVSDSEAPDRRNSEPVKTEKVSSLQEAPFAEDVSSAEPPPSANNPYSRESLQKGWQQIFKSMNSEFQYSNEQIAQHREEKFNNYLAITATAEAAAVVPARNAPVTGSQTPNTPGTNPYLRLKAEAESNPAAVEERRANPQTYLEKVYQLR